MLSPFGLPKAPPLTGEKWVNCVPVDAAVLRGRAVVVLFWAASCEASWVRLRQLEALQARHEGRVAVVAVHSPRFEYERDVALVESVVARRGLTVPVVHDPELQTWARYGPTGRPTVMVIDPNQRVIGATFGVDDRYIEGGRPSGLDEIVATQAALAKPYLAPLPVVKGAETSADLHRLSGPGAVTRLPDGRLAIVDTANSRLVVASLNEGSSASVSTVFGGIHGAGSIAARSDGTLAISFPDRGIVESLDLSTKQRTTIARGLVRPMGLVEDADGSLVVCDAGADEIIRVAEDRKGPIAKPVSQPLEVIRIDAGLLFTEAATGTLRLLSDDGKVRTINDGQRPGLKDGAAHKAMLQRPGALATLDRRRVAIADHGNSRIRLLADRKVTTVPIGGLSHPEGLLYLGNEQLLCSDTMNDRLVVIDLAKHTAAELTIEGLPV